MSDYIARLVGQIVSEVPRVNPKARPVSPDFTSPNLTTEEVTADSIPLAQSTPSPSAHRPDGSISLRESSVGSHFDLASQGEESAPNLGLSAPLSKARQHEKGEKSTEGIPPIPSSLSPQSDPFGRLSSAANAPSGESETSRSREEGRGGPWADGDVAWNGARRFERVDSRNGATRPAPIGVEREVQDVLRWIDAGLSDSTQSPSQEAVSPRPHPRGEAVRHPDPAPSSEWQVAIGEIQVVIEGPGLAPLQQQPSGQGSAPKARSNVREGSRLERHFIGLS